MSKIINTIRKAETIKPENKSICQSLQGIGLVCGVIGGPVGMVAGVTAGTLAAEGYLQARKALKNKKQKAPQREHAAKMAQRAAEEMTAIMAGR